MSHQVFCRDTEDLVVSSGQGRCQVLQNNDAALCVQAKKEKKKSKVVQSPATLASDASDDTALMSGDDSAAASPPADPLSVDNFPLSPQIKAALKGKGISSLFDIQAQTLSHVLGGKDVLGRAR